MDDFFFDTLSELMVLCKLALQFESTPDQTKHYLELKEKLKSIEESIKTFNESHPY